MSPSPRRPDISLAQVAGSALAAVSAAVIASFLGVGGTILGAALGSIVATIGGAVYAHSFSTAGRKLGQTRVVTVVSRPRHSAAGPRPSDVPEVKATVPETVPETVLGTVLGAVPGTVLGEGPDDGTRLLPPVDPPPRRISWKAAALLAVVAFALAIGAIEVFEVVIGRPVSGGSGGTTVTKLFNGGAKHRTKPTPTPTPTTTPTPSLTTTVTVTQTPTSTPTTSAPSETTSPTTTPTGTATTP